MNLVPGVLEIWYVHISYLSNKTTHFMAEIPFLLHG